jgi:hypothetical protein
MIRHEFVSLKIMTLFCISTMRWSVAYRNCHKKYCINHTEATEVSQVWMVKVTIRGFLLCVSFCYCYCK